MWVIGEEFWTQTLSLPASAVSGLGHEQIAKSIGFDVERALTGNCRERCRSRLHRNACARRRIGPFLGNTDCGWRRADKFKNRLRRPAVSCWDWFIREAFPNPFALTPDPIAKST